MSDVDLKIVLDDPKHTYRPGDKLTGHIEVVCDGDFDSVPLKLERFWEAEGGDFTDRGAETTLDLGEHDWRAGQTHTHPFETELPRPGPYQYDGTTVSVGWKLQAVAESGLFSDPTETKHIALVPSGDETHYNPGTGSVEEARDELLDVDEPQPGVGILFGSLFILAFLIPVGINGSDVANNGVVILVGIGLLFGVALLVSSVRQSLAKDQFSNVEIDVTPETVDAGKKVTCSVAIPKPARSSCRRMDMTLLRREKYAIRGHEDNNVQHDDRVIDQMTLRDFDAPSGGDEPIEYYAEFDIPEDGPASFRGGYNAITWAVRVDIDAENLPEWTRHQPVFVKPATAGASTNSASDFEHESAW